MNVCTHISHHFLGEFLHTSSLYSLQCFSAMLPVLNFGSKEAGCFREVAALIVR